MRVENFELFEKLNINLSGWVSAVSSAASALVAYFGFRLAKNTKDVAQKLEIIESDREYQPRYISGWLVGKTEPAFNQKMYVPSLKLALSNFSDEPVFNVVISIYRIFSVGLEDAQAIGTDQVAILPPRGTIERAIRSDILGELDREGIRSNLFRSLEDCEKSAQILADRGRVLMEFTDARGNRWTRNLNGIIEPKDS